MDWNPIRFTKNYNFHTAKSSPFSAANLLARGLENTLSPPDRAAGTDTAKVVAAGATAAGGGGGADTGDVDVASTAEATGAGAAAGTAGESSLKSLNAPTSD